MYRDKTSGAWFKVMSVNGGAYRAQTDNSFFSSIIVRKLDLRLTRKEANADLDAFAEEHELEKVIEEKKKLADILASNLSEDRHWKLVTL